MKKLISAAVVLAVATIAVSARAQGPSVKAELRPFFGMSIPTGDQRDLFDDATMFGLQGALELKPAFHLLGSFAWVPGKAKFSGAQQDVDVFQYDAGMEFNLVREMNESWLFKPFVGLGGGARTYLYAADALTDRTSASAYGTLGTEFQLNRTAIRLEGRGNFFSFKSPLPNVDSKTRNDVGVSLGVAYHFR